MILATLQQIVYTLREKPQGGGGWGVNLNVSSNYHASRGFFLEWLSLAFTKSVKNELVNAKKPCWKETSARRIKSQNKFQEKLTSAKRSCVTLATATKLSETKH